MAGTDDITPQLLPPTTRGTTFSQGTVLEWNPNTFRNKIEWRRTIMVNVPVMAGIESLTLQVGDEVGLLGWAPENGMASWWILGRIVIPGGDLAGVRTIRGAGLDIVSGRLQLRNPGVGIEMLTGNLAGELPGVLRSFRTAEGRAAVRLIPPRTQGPDTATELILEGQTNENPTGHVFFHTTGLIQQTATEGMIFTGSQGPVIVNADGNISLDAQSNLHLDGRNEAFLKGENRLHLLADGPIDVTASGAAINLRSGSGVSSGTTRISYRSEPAAANVHLVGADGEFVRDSSSIAHKRDIEDLAIDVNNVLRLRPRTWRNKAAVQRDPDTQQRMVGFISEEVNEILPEFVTRTPTGEPDLVMCDRLTAALVLLARQQQRQINDLIARVEALEGLVS